MPNNPIQPPLPADLPENWTNTQTIAAAGADVGLSKQHGYNYLMQQVNAAQNGVNSLGTALSGITPASLGAVPTSRTVNGNALSENIVLSSKDIGAIPKTSATVVLGTADNNVGYDSSICDFFITSNSGSIFSQAFNSLQDGDTLLVLPGIYQFTSYMNFIPDKEITIEGFGSSTKIQNYYDLSTVTSSQPQGVFSKDKVEGNFPYGKIVTIKNISFENMLTTKTAAYAIYNMYNNNTVKVENCTFTNFYNGTRCCNLESCVFEYDSTAGNSSYNIINASSGSAINCIFKRSIYSHGSHTGVYSMSLVCNCSFENMTTSIDLPYNIYNIISGNWFKSLESGGTNIKITNHTEGFLILGNLSYSQFHQITVTSCQNGVIAGNRFYENAKGIELVSSSQILVTGNSISPNLDAYLASTITLDTNTTNCLVTDNLIWGKNYENAGSNNTFANNKYN